MRHRQIPDACRAFRSSLDFHWFIPGLPLHQAIQPYTSRATTKTRRYFGNPPQNANAAARRSAQYYTSEAGIHEDATNRTFPEGHKKLESGAGTDVLFGVSQFLYMYGEGLYTYRDLSFNFSD